MEGQEKGRPDLEDVMREEKSRGRRPIDTAARRERAALRRSFHELLEVGDERDFIKAIKALGLREGSPRFLDALRVWREYRRR